MKLITLFLIFFSAVVTAAQFKLDIHFVLQPLGKRVYPHDRLCIRYFDLNNNLTDVHLSTDEVPALTKQRLAISITDNYGNILSTRENVPDPHTKITFIPRLNSIVDICLLNVVNDFSWAYKRRSREISLRLHQRGSKPKTSPTVIKDQKLQLQSLANSLRKIALKNVKATQRSWEDTKQIESEKRDLNEASFELLAYNFIFFAVASFVFNAGIFAILRRFDRDL